MNAAFEKGELRLYPFSDKGFIVTNAHLPGEFEVVTDLDDLFKKRVFRP
jgi:hypothetical protein